MSSSTKHRIGLIINPLAGIGGKVGLKGSDGQEIVRRAFELGAQPLAPARARTTLEALASLQGSLDIVTFPAEMGEQPALACGFEPIVLGAITSGATTSQDTRDAAQAIRDAGVDLILFVGGDGTARDIHQSIGTSVPVLGIPAGVKIHSSVYAISPRHAATVVSKFVDRLTALHELEVMDIDESLFREGRVSAQLYGYLSVPYERQLLQGAKMGSGGVASESASGIAHHIIDEMDDDCYYILGSGTTVKTIGDYLGIEKTLLGVDVVHQKQLIAKDVSEQQLLTLIEGKSCQIVVTVIGGQGFIFGRGNQQLSAKVISQVGRENIKVVATKAKLLTLDGALLVDTGDAPCDAYLSGYIKVITGYRQISMWKVRG